MAEPHDTHTPLRLTPAARASKSGRRRRTVFLRRRLTVARLAVAVVTLGLVWRVARFALGFPIWGDEAFVAVNFVVRGYADMIRPLEYGQIVPLVFMWAELAISRVLGLSEWALRLLPFLASLASLLLFWRFAARLLASRAALLALGLFAASYYPVRHAVELKPYSTDLLFSLGLTMLGWWVYQRPERARGWAALIGLGAIAGWCSYPSVFVLGAVGVFLTWTCLRPRVMARAVVGLLLFAVIAGGSCVAMYVLYARPHAEYAAPIKEIDMWAKTFPPLREPRKLVLWFFGMHTGNMMAYPVGGRAPGSIATFALVVIGAVRLFVGRKSVLPAGGDALGTAGRNRRAQRPLLVLLLAPLLFTFVAAAMRAYPYGGSARTSLYMAPAFCLLAGLGLDALLRKVLRLREYRSGWQVAMLALCGIAVAGIVSDVLSPYRSDSVYRSYRAVQHVVRETRPGDIWVAFNAVEPVDYAPYLGDWRGTGAQFVFDVLRFAPVSLQWAPPAGEVTVESPGRVWLLSYRGHRVQFPDEQLWAYLAELERRLGQPEQQRFVIKVVDGVEEALDVFVFTPAPATEEGAPFATE